MTEEEYLEHARLEMLPKLKQSATSIIILNSEPDIKLCTELGASILYEKPIIVLAIKGALVPDALRRLADRVVEVDELDEDAKTQMLEAVTEVLSNHFPQQIVEKK